MINSVAFWSAKLASSCEGARKSGCRNVEPLSGPQAERGAIVRFDSCWTKICCRCDFEFFNRIGHEPPVTVAAQSTTKQSLVSGVADCLCCEAQFGQPDL